MESNLTVDDVMRAGGCPSGIRRWFSAMRDVLPQGMTLHVFLSEGMPLEVVTAVDDAFLNRALALREAVRGE